MVRPWSKWRSKIGDQEQWLERLRGFGGQEQWLERLPGFGGQEQWLERLHGFDGQEQWLKWLRRFGDLKSSGAQRVDVLQCRRGRGQENRVVDAVSVVDCHVQVQNPKGRRP